jgi:hypothetical protein
MDATIVLSTILDEGLQLRNLNYKSLKGFSMIKKSAIEMERFIIMKVTRTMIRLKHSINAEREINDILPDRLDDFDRAIQSGELKQLPDEIFEDFGEIRI